MVVAASDSQALAMGLAEDASLDIPQDETLGMPMAADDADPSELDESVEAATETPPVLFDPATLDDALRASFDADYVSRKDLRGLQSTLERQKTELARQNERLADDRQFLINERNELIGLLQQHMDDGEFAKEMNRRMVAESQRGEQRRQSAEAYSGFMRRFTENHVQELTRLSRDEQGRQLFDPEDPDIAQQFQRFMGSVKQHARAGFADNHPMKYEAERELDRIGLVIERKIADGRARLATQGRVQTARKTQAARDTQAARGVQNVSRGGASALAPMTAEEAMAKARAAAPNATPTDIYLTSVRLMREREAEIAQRQPRR